MKAPQVNLGAGAVLALVGLGAAAYLFWRGKRAVEEGALNAVNPLSDQNLAYKGVNAVGEWFSGNKDWTLGSALYDLLNGDPLANQLAYERQLADGMTHGPSMGNNPNNLNPNDLIPAGYRVNQWGGLEPIGQTYSSVTLSTSAANDARRVFAATDPRRTDIQPEGTW